MTHTHTHTHSLTHTHTHTHSLTHSHTHTLTHTHTHTHTHSLTHSHMHACMHAVLDENGSGPRLIDSPTLVKNIMDLRVGGLYVACGREQYQPLQYGKVSDSWAAMHACITLYSRDNACV